MGRGSGIGIPWLRWWSALGQTYKTRLTVSSAADDGMDGGCADGTHAGGCSAWDASIQCHSGQQTPLNLVPSLGAGGVDEQALGRSLEESIPPPLPEAGNHHHHHLTGGRPSLPILDEVEEGGAQSEGSGLSSRQVGGRHAEP